MKTLFRSQHPKPSTSASSSTASQSEGPLVRADRALKNLRAGQNLRNRRRNYKPYSRTTCAKEVQKGLVLINFQGDNPSEVMPLREYDKLYDGCIRYRADMKEEEIRDEITRLLRRKECDTHHLDLLAPGDFDFVRCANRRVRVIDGDTPFDGSGISQVYKNGAIYVRLNNEMIECVPVSAVWVIAYLQRMKAMVP